MRPQWVHFFFGLADSEDNLDTLIKFSAGSSDLTQFDDINVGRYFDDVAFINDDVSTMPAENQ